MTISPEIFECEVKYTMCFSNKWENAEVIRFTDELIPDMYAHNFTYVKKELSEKRLREVINEEISLRSPEFCNIYLNKILSDDFLNSLGHKPEISIEGFYAFDITNLNKIKTVPGCLVKKAISLEDLDDILYSDLQLDEDCLGRDFCERRCYRRGKVYLSSEDVNSYICYHNNEVIGSCDLFIDNYYAKIEDFSVIPKHQRKGYGSTILKKLIEISLSEDCHTIYLVTDEADTAREMYLKTGFKKIGERMTLFFKKQEVENGKEG